MALQKGLIFLFAFKEGIHAADLEFHFDFAGQAGSHFRQCQEGFLFGVHGRAHGGKEVGVFHFDGMFLIQLQGSDKGSLQLGQEVERAAKKSDMSPDGLATGQAADGLVDDGLEDGGGQVFPCGSIVDQRLNI